MDKATMFIAFAVYLFSLASLNMLRGLAFILGFALMSALAAHLVASAGNPYCASLMMTWPLFLFYFPETKSNLKPSSETAYSIIATSAMFVLLYALMPSDDLALQLAVALFCAGVGSIWLAPDERRSFAAVSCAGMAAVLASKTPGVQFMIVGFVTLLSHGIVQAKNRLAANG